MRFVEAKDRSLANILSDNRFRIDSFQREYRWQRKQIEALISDLATAFEKNYKPGDTLETYEEYGSYYMGPIVLCDDKKELSIVDGQQRLTSFTLLLIYLLHAQNDLGLKEELKTDIRKHLFVRRGAKDTLILNVESRAKVIQHLIDNPDTIFEDVEELEENLENSAKPSKDESIQNIIERYEDITILFPEDLYDNVKLPIFIEWLLNNVVLVEIRAFSMESAYTIFETMNDRGLSLNPTEILKGYLLSMIDDDTKSEEMNVFWKERVFDIKSAIGTDSDLDFFRNWLRAKYAETQRSKTKGSENLDFEQIGTQFHSWVKSNTARIFLKKSDDYYYFIKSDFDFYSSIYINLYSYKNEPCEDFESLYIANFYTIADSLSYPLFLSPISKIDSEESMNQKIYTVNRFIDNYTVFRTFQNKAITQSTIRNYIYDLVREIRNSELSELQSILKTKLLEITGNNLTAFEPLQVMNNWGFYHYFFARILYYFADDDVSFESLLRSKKQISYILCSIYFLDNNGEPEGDTLYLKKIDSVANYVLIRRNHAEQFNGLNISRRLKFLTKHNYLPEMVNEIEIDDINTFIEKRDKVLRGLVKEIWHMQ
ncbi:Uncharacterized conserved protein, contains ParB-like and HNH nuclease domains [Mucilaginibacter sp. OK268]|uniref:DUF262 domain-containing protein n=1 Tax=Mucilaginibacter sp. OK268 TaxID=1881048 RepID=UPI000889028D|nr:DUF262 domain-containing protein [Mucilaginibacter sp. OK268]SDQ01225.1 Uncharacterized conserved protein, contains ParB-like and HNH nuclease domains [Mucilaginibacter sp. OK268]